MVLKSSFNLKSATADFVTASIFQCILVLLYKATQGMESFIISGTDDQSTVAFGLERFGVTRLRRKWRLSNPQSTYAIIRN